MLTGRPPFIGATWKELADKHRTVAFPLLPPEQAIFQELLLSCVEKAPANRLANFSMVKSELTDIWHKITQENVPEAASMDNMDAIRWSQKGASLVALERYKEGLLCLDTALKENPEDWRALTNRGVALSNLGRKQDALESYEEGLKIKPDSVELWSNKAFTLYQELAHTKEALECAERAISIDKYHPAPWINKGQCLRSVNKVEEALSCYNYALSVSPYSYDAWANKGQILIELKRSKQDILECADQCLRLNSRKYSGWALKAEALSGMGILDQALLCSERALELGIPSYAYWHIKGMAYLRNGRDEEAVKCFDEILERFPEDGAAWYNKGLALMYGGEEQKAMDCFEKTSSLNVIGNKTRGLDLWDRYGEGPSNPERWKTEVGSVREAEVAFREGLLSARAGHPDEAVEHFAKALRAKETPEAWFNKGRALAEVGQLREALECFEKALELDDKDPETWINVGAIYAGLGHHKEELEAYDRVLELDPSCSDAWFNKSAVFASAGNIGEAVKCLDRLIELDPVDADAWYNKGVLWLEETHYSKALKCFKKAYSLGHPKAKAAISWCENRSYRSSEIKLELRLRFGLHKNTLASRILLLSE
jgi:tetratricopeptide (TPR) repeat protein